MGIVKPKHHCPDTLRELANHLDAMLSGPGSKAVADKMGVSYNSLRHAVSALRESERTSSHKLGVEELLTILDESAPAARELFLVWLSDRYGYDLIPQTDLDDSRSAEVLLLEAHMGIADASAAHLDGHHHGVILRALGAAARKIGALRVRYAERRHARKEAKAARKAALAV